MPRFLLLCVFFILNVAVVFGQQLSLKIIGDQSTGFRVNIYDGTQLLVTNTEELSLQLFNLDLSTTANIPQWKGQNWSGNESCITVKGDSYIKEFDANQAIVADGKVESGHIRRRTMEVCQSTTTEVLHKTMQQTARSVQTLRPSVTFIYSCFNGG